MSFNNKIRFVDVSFKYPDTENYVLQNLNLEMEANSSIALVGSTGSGKSTLADLVAGLLLPNKGKIFIDDEPLSSMNVRDWHRNIAYVPQEIFLFDDTYEKNIAMSDCSENTNSDHVKSAAFAAKATDFIMSQKSGFHSIVGENGINLSGGQKQRIGIARAIYASPNLLILDEATSALDNQTEKLVMEEVISTNKKRTVLIVAHRLSTIRHCDQIIFLQEGKIISSGTYEELLSRCKEFEKLVKAGLQQNPVIN
jgi:ATP-binding cassette, subfamily B, bacterial PglK